MVRAEARLAIHRGGVVLIDERIRQGHLPDLQTAFERADLGEMGQDAGAEAALRPVLHRDDRVMSFGQALDEIRIERLDEARVGQRRLDPFGGERIGGLTAIFERIAEGGNAAPLDDSLVGHNARVKGFAGALNVGDHATVGPEE